MARWLAHLKGVAMAVTFKVLGRSDAVVLAIVSYARNQAHVGQGALVNLGQGTSEETDTRPGLVGATRPG
jgi:hypothetical protein